MRYRSESRVHRGPDYDFPGQRWYADDDGGRRPAGRRDAGRRGSDRRGRARGSAGRAGSRRWRYKSRLVKVGYVTGSLVTALVVVASLGAYAEYRHLTGNISSVKVTGLSHRSVYGAQNILLLGLAGAGGGAGRYGRCWRGGGPVRTLMRRPRG